MHAQPERPVDSAAVSSKPLPRKRVWPWLVLFAVIIAGAALLVWRQLTAPSPIRVIVAVSVDGQWWEGSKPAAAVADAVAEQLTSLGFEPVRAGDPETAAVLEDAPDLDAAARKLRAAFVIEARVKPELSELPVEGGWLEARFDAPLRVRYVGEEIPASPLSGWAVAPGRERVLEILAAAVAQQVTDAAVPALVGHESIQDILAGHDAKLVDRLVPAKHFTEARAAALERANAAYKALDETRAKEKAIHFVSEPNTDERLCAVTALGALGANAPVTPFYGGSDALLRRLELERLAWRADSEAILWRGYSAFTYPSATPDGKHIALIEDLYGRGRALTILEDGKPRRVKVEAERSLSEPRISSDGKLVALADKLCRGCPKEVSVLDVTGAKASERFRLDAKGYATLSAFRWLDNKHLLLLATPSDESKEALWALNPFEGKRVSLMVPEDGAQLVDPTASADAKTVAASHYNADAIVTLDVAANSVTSHAVGGRATALTFSPDGKRIAFELRDGEYHDIAVLDLKTLKVTRLTRNDSPDRYPLFSPDGKRIYFEARNADPVFGSSRAVSRIAWVPAP